MNMKLILNMMILLVFNFSYGYGQCVNQILNTSGTSVVNGINVTATSNGVVDVNNIYCPATLPYFIGYQYNISSSGLGSYTFNFSPAINAATVNISGISNSPTDKEEVQIYVNGSHYSIPSLGSANGCDTMALLTSSGNIIAPNNTSVSGCLGINLNGTINSITLVDSVLFGSPNGAIFSIFICDSSSSTNFFINQTICQGKSYLGYSQTGTYIDTFTNINNTDSIQTLNLFVIQPVYSSVTQTICQGQSYLGYTNSGIYVDTLVSSSGCDSIRTLNLNVLSNISSNITQTICQGLSYLGYTNSGIYIDTLVNSFGCDSVRILELQVTNDLCCIQFVPNAFSPNRDNLNDFYSVKGFFEEYEITIANRFGNIVFKGTDNELGWDGKYLSEDAPIGTYYFYLKYRCLKSKESQFLKGDLILIR